MTEISAAMKQKGPQARVIACTHFLGVPEELMPAPTQDQGSEGARLVEMAGRVCYNSYGKGRDSAAYAQHILESGHGSVLEHVSLSFYITGISRLCSHEFVRHRHAAISQRSTRYVDESESEWCWHPALALLDRQELRRHIGLKDCVEATRDLYTAIVERLEPLVGRKQARGAARGVLGGALSTAMVWTANLRALRHIIALRASEQADGEIRLLAVALHQAALEVCPEYMSDFERYPAPDGIGYCLRVPRSAE